MAETPVVDFKDYGLHVDAEHTPTDEQLKELAGDVYNALTGVGFMYIKNHGISADLIKRMESVAKEFFNLPKEEKEKFCLTADLKNGYTGIGGQKLGGSLDVKEIYDFDYSLPPKWPKNVPGFDVAFTEMFKTFSCLLKRVLEVMALSLQQERTFFTKLHNILTKKNGTNLRILNYPKMPADFTKTESQMRLGEHTDWGTVTLIAQDSVGGLQMKSRSGDWIDVIPKDGCIIVLIAELMQRWTSDKFQANPHRVVNLPCEPKSIKGGEKSRFSMLYFGNPDGDAVINSIDDSKYEPIKAKDHFDELWNESFGGY